MRRLLTVHAYLQDGTVFKQTHSLSRADFGRRIVLKLIFSFTDGQTRECSYKTVIKSVIINHLTLFIVIIVRLICEHRIILKTTNFGM